MEFTLTHPDGSTLALNSRANQCAVTSAKQSKALLSDDTITIEVLSATPLPLQIGDKLTAVGSTYTLNQLPAAKKTAANEYKYTIILEGLQYALLDRVFLLPDGTRGDDLMTDLEGALKVLIENANRNNGGKPYVLAFCPEGSKYQNINYAGSNCLRALQQMCEDWDVEFKLTETDTAINLSIVTDTPPFSIPFSVGRKGGVYELNRNKPSEDIVTRLYAYGGTENLTYYRHTRLCLPGKERKQSYIEDTAAVNTYGLRESVKNFDDIIPQREGKVTKLGGSYKSFVDSTIDFDLNEKWASTEAQCLEWITLRGIENTAANRKIYYDDVAGKSTRYLIDGQTAQVHFQSGALAGYDIDIESYDHATKTLKLIPLVDNNQYSFPSQTSSAFQFAVGDKYIFVGINLPESYKTAAEAKLLESAQEFYAQHCKPRASYTLSIAPLWLQRMVGGGDESAVYNVFDVGDLIHVDDEALGISEDIRVQSFERDLLSPYDYKLTISDTTEVKTIARVVGDVSTITRVVDTSGIADPNRQRRSWLTAQEVLNRTFDTEGHYYSDKIAPLSIETQMLAVGARSQQFTLANVLFYPNALNGSTADPQKLMSTAGQLIHYTIDPGAVKVWTMSALSVTGLAKTALYVYAKCARNGDGGVFVVDGVQRVFDADPSYYFFLIGTLSSVDEKYNTRTLSLTYGSSTINGRYIKTGRISSNDGKTYFDLDTGRINGKITFTNSAGDAEDLTDALAGIQNSADEAKEAAENIKVGGRNYITSKSSHTKWTCTDGVWYCGEITSDYWRYSSSQHRGISLASGGYVLTVWLLDTTEESYNGMIVYKSDGTAIVGSASLGNKLCKAGKYQWKFTLAAAAEIGIQIKNRGRYRIQLEEGTLGTDWTPAPEDVDGAISNVDTKAQQGIDNAAAADRKAGDAKTLANTANTAAGKAADAAKSAQNTANTANTAAGKAADAAKSAQNTANTAEANAQKGIAAAANAQNKADTAGTLAQLGIDKVNNLKIGGRNYLYGTATAKTATGGGSSASSDLTIYLYNGDTSGEAWAAGTEVTFSCDFDATAMTGGTCPLLVNKTWHKITEIKPGMSGHLSATFTLSVAITAKEKVYLQGKWDGKVIISKAKWEIGNKDTSWTEAPEEVDARVAAAQSTATSAAQSAEDANSKIDGLQLGGTNLHPFTGGGNWVKEMSTNTAMDGDTLSVSGTSYNYSRGAEVSLGETYTISFDVKSTVAGSSYILQEYRGSDYARYYYPSYGFNVSTSWTRVATTITIDTSYPYTKYLCISFRTSSGTCSYRHLKIERGNRASDWSPSPDDVQLQIKENKFLLNAFQTTKDALGNDKYTTDVVGGVVLSNFLGVKDLKTNIAVAGIVSPVSADEFPERAENNIAFFAGAQTEGAWNTAPFSVTYDGEVRMSKAEITSASDTGGELLLGDGKISVTNGSKTSRFTCDNHGTISSAFPKSTTTTGTFTALDYTDGRLTIVSALSATSHSLPWAPSTFKATRTITGFPSGTLSIASGGFTVTANFTPSSVVSVSSWSCSVTVSYKLTLNGTTIQSTTATNHDLSSSMKTVSHDVPALSKEIDGGTLVETFTVTINDGTFKALTQSPSSKSTVNTTITMHRVATSAKVVSTQYFNKYFSNGMLQNAADQRYLAYLCGATDGLDLRQRCGKYGFDVVLDKGMLFTRYDSATPKRYRMNPLIYSAACTFKSSDNTYTIYPAYNGLNLTFTFSKRNGTGDVTITHNIGNTNYTPLAMGSGTNPRYVTLHTKTTTSIRFLISDDDSTNDGNFYFYIFDYSTF